MLLSDVDVVVLTWYLLQMPLSRFMYVLHVSFTQSLPICPPLSLPLSLSPLPLMYSCFQKANLSLRERKASWGQLAPSTIFSYHTLFTFSQTYSWSREMEVGGGNRGNRERMARDYTGVCVKCERVELIAVFSFKHIKYS